MVRYKISSPHPPDLLVYVMGVGVGYCLTEQLMGLKGIYNADKAPGIEGS